MFRAGQQLVISLPRWHRRCPLGKLPLDLSQLIILHKRQWPRRRLGSEQHFTTQHQAEDGDHCRFKYAVHCGSFSRIGTLPHDYPMVTPVIWHIK